MRERLGYFEAFQRMGVAVNCLDDAPGSDVDLRAIAAAGLRPVLVIQPDGAAAVLPAGLEHSSVATACFHIDSFVAWERRARWAQLFDRVFVFHPGDVERYRSSGSSEVVALFHAARLETLQAAESERDLDLAVVGRTDGLYHRRRRCLESLGTALRTNDWVRSYRPEEVAPLYARAKMVLNVGRDDYPADVGVRYGEAMIAGALFVTILPTELSGLGFVEGRDYVGFHGPEDLLAICRRYLADDEARLRIASAGQARVLAHHTYDKRAETILKGSREPSAAARRWRPERCALTRLDYFAAKGRLREAIAEWQHIGPWRGALTARALELLARSAGRRVLSQASKLARLDLD